MAYKRQYKYSKEEAPQYPEDDILRPLEYTDEIHQMVKDTAYKIYSKHRKWFKQFRLEYDDYANECAERCWKGFRDKFRGACSPTSFAYIICLNHYRNLVVKYSGNKGKMELKVTWEEDPSFIERSEIEVASSANSKSPDFNVEEDVPLDELFEKRQLIFRKMLYMRRNISVDIYMTMYRLLKGMSYKDISEMDECTATASRVKVFRFMQLLKTIRVKGEYQSGDEYVEEKLIYI